MEIDLDKIAENCKSLSDKLRNATQPKKTKTIAKKDKPKGDKKKENRAKTEKSKDNEKKENKPKSQIKKKKEKKNEGDDMTVRKWNDFKDKDDFKKGSFTKDENDKILEAICNYVYDNNLTQVDLINLVTEKQTKDKSVWPKIAECLPNRSVQSIHNYCHRVLNPFNYKGAWSHEEEKKLIE
jgi:hypothetical protein